MAAGFDGPLGWLAAKVMGYTNAEAEAEAVELLTASPGERLLVVGFGPGVGLEILARLCPDTMITAVDPSAAMLRSAARRNRAAISAGGMTLHQTTLAGLQTSACSFDAAIAVHTLQFLEPLEDEAVVLAKRLRPSGRLVTLTHDWSLARRAGSVEAFLDHASVAFAHAGFHDIRHGRGRAERGRVVVFRAVRGD